MNEAWRKEEPVSLDNRIVRLEATQEHIQERLNTLSTTLAELVRGVEAVRVMLAGQKQCPDPGACVTLRETSRRMEDRLAALERQRDRADGFLSAAKLAWLGVGGVAGALASYLIKRL